jgi:ClpP class serine protease
MDLYDNFTRQVAEGRGMTVGEVDEVGQGRVWSGEDGLELGLVDEIGGLWASLQQAKRDAGIDPDYTVEFEEGPDLGRFDLSGLFPRIPGFGLFGGEAEAPAPERETLAPTGTFIDQLSDEERIYLLQLLENQQKPQLLTPPIGIGELDYRYE